MEFNEKDLLHFLRNIRDLEASKYQLKKYRNYLNNLLYQAQHPKLLDLKRDVKPEYEGVDLENVGNALKIVVPIGLLIWLFLLRDDRWFLGLIVISLSVLLIVFLINFRRKSIGIKRAKEFNNAIAIRNNKIQSENYQTLDYYRRQIPLIQVEQNRVGSLISQVNETLNKYYNTGVIYPKYYGLVPITMFCEYIESGRCSSLTGYNGAYNTYENENRLNIIITKLDIIIKN
ncbi:MAG: hypothetical protein IKP82_03985 [Oscillospiraceae bacterium]|nr:hypothetical protein [Oscillospiraceae bacterium]